LTYFIKKRLEPMAKGVIGEYEAEYPRSRSTMDHIFTMKQISETCWEHNAYLFKMYIDFLHACDRIDRAMLSWSIWTSVCMFEQE
jgi:hypothetical protein